MGIQGARKFARGMLEEARHGAPWTMARGLDYYETILRTTHECANKRDVERANGYLYEVAIPANGLLLWDAPMSDQPADVLSALRAHGFGRGSNRAGEWLANMWCGLRDSGFEDISAFAPNSAQEAMSRWLLSIGVRGIQYLDSSSRAATGGASFNFVVVDEDDIQIERVTEATPRRQKCV